MSIKNPQILINITIRAEDLYTYYDEYYYINKDNKVGQWLRKIIREEIDGPNNSDSKLSEMSPSPKCASTAPTYTWTGDMSPPTEFQVW